MKIVNEPEHGKTSKISCVPSEDSDQPGHPHENTLSHCLSIKRTAKTDRTGGSESSLGAQVILLVLSCCGSIL